MRSGDSGGVEGGWGRGRSPEDAGGKDPPNGPGACRVSGSRGSTPVRAGTRPGASAGENAHPHGPAVDIDGREAGTTWI